LITLGILHGANDYLISQEQTSLQLSIWSFIAGYVLFAVLIGFLVYLNPIIGANVFVVLSAYHFGEEHFSWWTAKKIPAFHLWIFTYGLTIFGLLFLTHLDELQFYLQSVGSNGDFLKWSHLYIIPIVVIQVVIGMAFLFLGKIKWFNFVVLQLSLVLLYLIFTQLDLLQAFVFYFVFWHSLPSIISQLRLLNWSGERAFLEYFKKALPFYITTLVGLAILLWVMGNQFFGATAIIIMGAMTTLPHVVLFAFARGMSQTVDE
jgi:Brp/Blh family beta-carotene 15,15'-monooxygenase